MIIVMMMEEGEVEENFFLRNHARLSKKEAEKHAKRSYIINIRKNIVWTLENSLG